MEIICGDDQASGLYASHIRHDISTDMFENVTLQSQLQTGGLDDMLFEETEFQGKMQTLIHN